MTSLADGMILAKDFGLMTFLPAILVFAIVYSILTKTEVLGENPWANVLVSVVTAILFIVVIKAVEFTNEFLPLIAVAVIVLVFLWMMLKFVGVEGVFAADTGKWGIASAIMVVVLIIMGVAFKKVSPNTYSKITHALSSMWSAMADSAVLGVIVLFSVFILVAYAILKESK